MTYIYFKRILKKKKKLEKKVFFFKNKKTAFEKDISKYYNK